MFHRHALGEIVRVESPGVDHLFTMRVDEADRLASEHSSGFAFAGGDDSELWRGFVILRHFSLFQLLFTRKKDVCFSDQLWRCIFNVQEWGEEGNS